MYNKIFIFADQKRERNKEIKTERGIPQEVLFRLKDFATPVQYFVAID